MSILIEGYLVVSTKKLRDHAGHTIHTLDQAGRIALRCMDDEVDIEVEPEPVAPALPCGCPDQAEHDEGVEMQERFRKDYALDSLVCVGCYLGDDGPSMHSCYVHQF